MQPAKKPPESLDAYKASYASQPALLSPRGRDWPWWEYVLYLPAVTYLILYWIVPPSLRISLFKLFGLFMAAWILLGVIAVVADPAAGHRAMRAEMDREYGARYHFVQNYHCVSPGMNDFWHGPMGGLLRMGIGCSGFFGSRMLESIGLPSAGHAVAGTYYNAEYVYLDQGSLSFAWFWLGLLLFWELMILPLWVLYLLIRFGVTGRIGPNG